MYGYLKSEQIQFFDWLSLRSILYAPSIYDSIAETYPLHQFGANKIVKSFCDNDNSEKLVS